MAGQAGAAAARTVAPAASAATGQLVDASYDDIIRSIARQHGVNPALALAVAKKESNKTPGVIGDAGKAVGMFQLHEGAAADTGVDRTDPIQNITGGVKYLKQLSDRYQGDLNKTLMAYNGGMGNVDKGSVSPEAQAYAAEVMANLSAGMREVASAAPGSIGTGRSSGAGPGNVGRSALGSQDLPGAGQMVKSAAYSIGQGFNPMTTTGRSNIAATAGSVGGALLTRGLPVGTLATKIATLLAPAIGASTAAAGERAVEEAIGTAPPGQVAKTGLTQGLLDIGGQAIMWPLRSLGRRLVSPRVAKAAETGLKRETDATKAAGQAAVQQVRDEVALAQQMLKTQSRQATRRVAADAVSNVGAARRTAAESLAAVEAAGAAELTAIKKTYDDLLQHVPGQIAGGQAVKQVLDGPTKRALDLAGQRVAEAAESGPEIAIAPIRELVNELAGQHRPSVMFPAAAPMAQGAPTIAARPLGVPAGGRMSVEDYRAFMAGKLGLPETHPLPGLLGKIQAIDPARSTISFKEAHQIKMLLDEAVNWDRSAKKHVEKITKNLRVNLREAMAGHAPYDEATAAYRAVVPLYRKGVGKRLLALSNTPDGLSKIATSLETADAAQAMTIKQLLVDQAAAGGDALAGQRAWNAVRAQYTFDKVIAGGIDGLEARVNKLVSLNPEFVRTIYGDATGQNVLKNLGALAEAHQTAVARIAEETAAAKLAGQQAVTASRSTGREAIRTARDQADDLLTQSTRQGQRRTAAVRESAKAADTQQKLKNTKFATSSLAPFAHRTVLDTFADVAQAGALGPGSWWGAKAGLRLLTSARSADLIEWAAYSPRGTRVLVDLLTRPGITPQAGGAILRELGAAFGVSGEALDPSRIPALANVPQLGITATGEPTEETISLPPLTDQARPSRSARPTGQ